MTPRERAELQGLPRGGFRISAVALHAGYLWRDQHASFLTHAEPGTRPSCVRMSVSTQSERNPFYARVGRHARPKSPAGFCRYMGGVFRIEVTGHG